MDCSTAAFTSPLGELYGLFNSHGELLRLSFFPLPAKFNAPFISPPSLTTTLQQALNAYFSGQTRGFDIALAPQGTEFQKNVWQALQNIPHGSTLSYRNLAHEIGHPKAVRAVARANALNPIAILIPCHRVIGSDGSLTGYAYGLERKLQLLKLEGSYPEALQTNLFA